MLRLTAQANFETIVLFVSVVLVNYLLQDGRTNYMEGVYREFELLVCGSFVADEQVMALYLVIALSYIVS